MAGGIEQNAFTAGLENGCAGWEVTARVQLVEAQDEGLSWACLPFALRGDFERLTGLRPLTVGEWCRLNAHHFLS